MLGINTSQNLLSSTGTHLFTTTNLILLPCAQAGKK